MNLTIPLVTFRLVNKDHSSDGRLLQGALLSRVGRDHSYQGTEVGRPDEQVWRLAALPTSLSLLPISSLAIAAMAQLSTSSH